ncbi:glucose-6-phosphate isomerase [Thioalkalivibrio paradoxus]|uniref:Glucose-6-phosphate isomerase n=1 Tax=Thioalkalivibrio paradoxus ARh 1 TaxID=713585 RepID=W0DPE3_9GAMM|nr:glucose-6-phosphate isomerase [Thioalkalivibrio paradoxus]AHE99122.1 glucose-6-phosphate isomerase [Thioalkalivibrio paradoxus ARh 1]
MSQTDAALPWPQLAEARDRLRDIRLRDLLAEEPGRVERDVLDLAGMRLDWTRQRLDEAAWQALYALAGAARLDQALEHQNRGEHVNTTEDRAALHMALRLPREAQCMIDGRDVVGDVHAVLDAIGHLVRGVHDGSHRGYSGRPIRSVVNIGIGGSDLGPRMVCRALAPLAVPAADGRALDMHFVSNIDGAALDAVLAQVDPETTLFIVASKTFGTQETLTNARSARSWLLRHTDHPEAVSRHFVAVSTHAERVAAFGIDTRNMFGFWDWVGGRYSVWSAIGLPIALYLGMDGFRAFLAGAHAMDRHVLEAPVAANAAMRMALVDVWNHNLLGACARVVLPYDERLKLLPSYLQQAEMESLGKGVRHDGRAAERETGALVWGAVGTDGQHAFYQLLHQGTRWASAEFIGVAQPEHGLPEHHPILLANLVAQAEALALGKTAAEATAEMAAQGLPEAEVARLAPHRSFPGNRPSTVILLERLDPQTLGALIALYEHKIYLLATLWDINAFDQWGVELGKQLAGRVLEDFAEPGAGHTHDAATQATIDWLRQRLQQA